MNLFLSQVIPVNYTYGFLALTLLLTFFIAKRLGKTGCIGFGYVALIVGAINLFTVLVFFLISTAIKDLYAIPFGINYTAEVIDSVSKSTEDGTMYSPIVAFTTQSGAAVTEELSFSSGSLQNSYYINYNEDTGKLIPLGFILALKLAAAILFGVIFIFSFTGIILYAGGINMSGYLEVVKVVGLKFFLPLIMIGFDALLIYALFYGNEMPIFILGILVFFIFMLTLGIWGYIKAGIWK
ncbi:hypothetical protein [Olleya sp. HaHaR_3_96]|uniref:hypothetical protein n=1 Tax=Olleya sp. HaHaR_3_96 TaxID=2745560 RepID=UPI001C4FE57D|nr:hypothetical protein [Olleya sp. HaHaR_3_96]QXP61841.1 hypothetical protein H0I26_09595 [Olleya sp. HaHaR_3_96]